MINIEKRDDMLENQRLHFIDFAKHIAAQQFTDKSCEIPGGRCKMSIIAPDLSLRDPGI